MNSQDFDKVKVEGVGIAQVIFLKCCKGTGSSENPTRLTLKFYLKTGEFIGEIDSLTAGINHIDSFITGFLGENQVAQR